MSIQKNLINRRKFLSNSAAATAAGGLMSPAAKAEDLPSQWDKQVDVVIVGTGPCRAGCRDHCDGRRRESRDP